MRALNKIPNYAAREFCDSQRCCFGIVSAADIASLGVEILVNSSGELLPSDSSAFG